MARGLKESLQVEWVNVTYRSLVVLLGTLLIGALGAASFWFYFHRFAPREEAQSAVRIAVARLAEARKIEDRDRVDEILDGAQAALTDAEERFAALDYPNAVVAAIHSENLSIKALATVKGEESSARLVRFFKVEGDVRVKQAGAFAWNRADTRMVLQVGDQVKTSSSASAELIYFDGTRTRIHPGSLMEIRDLYEDPVTKVRRVHEKLTWGEVQASTQKRNVQGSFHQVSTEKVQARAEQAGEFRIAHDQQRQDSVVDVFGGRIEVATPSKKTTLDAGQRVTARADGRLSPKQLLPGLPRLITPTDQRVFIFDDPQREQITLSWKPVSGGDRYRLMIANKSLFTQPLYDAERDESNAVIQPGQSGSYHWKVAAISLDGLQGPFSEPRRFRVTSQQIHDRTDTEPPPLEISEFVPVGQMVIINGKTEPGATLWVDDTKFSVFEDGSFNAVVRLHKEGLNELVIVAQDTAGNQSRQNRSAFVELY